MKKLLALVLALVMTLGLATVGANAAYKDADDIEYKEAVDVMSAIGVLGGADGAFNPKGILTREQGAKIITYMLAGGQTAGDALTTATAPFDDVAADRWSAGSIAYCKTLGIVGGVGDNKFNPEGTLTGYQFAKMLLVALGYDAEIEKLGGDGWEFNVAKLITNINLSSGITGFAGSTGVSREIAAQLGYNTLRSTMVYYASSQNVGISGTNAGGVSVGTELQASNVENTATTYEANGTSGITAASTDGEPLDTMQLCEKYFPKLKLNTAGQDTFKRPGDRWTLGGVKIGDYASEAAKVYTSYMDTEAGRKQIYDDLHNYNNYGYADGAAGASNFVKRYVNGYERYNGANAVNSSGTSAAVIAALTGNGRAVEIYVDANAITNIVVVDTVVGQVAKVDTKNETISINFDVTDGNGGNGGPGNDLGSVGAASQLTTDKGYGTFKKDDYVLVTFTDATDGIIDTSTTESVVRSVAAPTVVTGIASTKNSAADEFGTITVAGTLYKAAYNIYTANNVANFSVSNSKDATLLLDANGYIVGAKSGTTAISDKSVVVLDEYLSLDSNGKQVCMIKGVTADGETVRWITDRAGGTNNYTKGKVYTYATNSDDQYVLFLNASNMTTATAPGSGSTTGTDNTKYTVAYGPLASELKSSTKSITGTALNGAVYVDDTTNYIFVNNGSGSWKATTVAGAQKVAAGTTIHIALKFNSSNNTWFAAAIYVLNAEAPVSANSASDVVFVKGASAGTTQVTDSSKGKAVTRTVYNAWIDGEEQDNVYAKSAATGFYTIDKNADTGELNFNSNTRYTSTSGSYAVTGFGTVTSAKNNVLITSTGSYNIAGATIVDTVSDDGTDYDTADEIDAAAATIAAYVMYNANTGAASYVYIVSAGSFTGTTVDVTAKINKALAEEGGATIAAGGVTAAGNITVPLGATLNLGGNTLAMGSNTLTINGTVKGTAGSAVTAATDITVSGGSLEAGTVTVTGGHNVVTANGATITATSLTATELYVGCEVTVEDLAVTTIEIKGDDNTSALTVTKTLTDAAGNATTAITIKGSGAELDLSKAASATVNKITVDESAEGAAIAVSATTTINEIAVSENAEVSVDAAAGATITKVSLADGAAVDTSATTEIATLEVTGDNATFSGDGTYQEATGESAGDLQIGGTAGTDDTIKALLTSAKEYKYSDNRAYAGTITVKGAAIEYSISESAAAESEGGTNNIVGDLARFIGALYWVDNGKTAKKIVYNNVAYTWYNELTDDNGALLVGSRWAAMPAADDDDGEEAGEAKPTTLVSAIVSAIVSAMSEDDNNEGSLVLTVNNTEVTFTGTITPAQASPDGSAAGGE